MQRLLFIIMQISLLITMLMSWCPPVKVVEGLRPGVYPRFFLPVFNHVSSVTEFFIFFFYFFIQFTSSASQPSLKCHIFLKFHHSFLTFHYKCLVQNPISLISKASLFYRSFPFHSLFSFVAAAAVCSKLPSLRAVVLQDGKYGNKTR